MPKLDELFTADFSISQRKPNNLSSVQSKDLPRKKTAIPSSYVSPEGKSTEGSDERVKPISGDPNINRENCSGVLESVSRACHGNRYLEGMILGEILNSPRFRGNYRK